MKLVIKDDGKISFEEAPVPHDIEEANRLADLVVEVATDRLADELRPRSHLKPNALDLHPGLHSALISLVFHTDEPKDGLAIALEAALTFARAEGVTFEHVADVVLQAQTRIQSRAWCREVIRQIVSQVDELKKIARNERRGG